MGLPMVLVGVASRAGWDYIAGSYYVIVPLGWGSGLIVILIGLSVAQRHYLRRRKKR